MKMRSRADWMAEAKWGVFMHFIAETSGGIEPLGNDVDAWDQASCLSALACANVGSCSSQKAPFHPSVGLQDVESVARGLFKRRLFGKR
ncbi:MAG: hypothetical protein WAX69_18445 [Victivallales bacterium]